MREFLVNHICLNGCDDAHTVNDAHQVIGGLQSSCIKRRLQVLAGVKGQPKSLRALPVLSLGATRDRLLTHAATTSIKRAFPNAQSVWIDAPHFILQTRADECWAHIARFVATGPG
jgi:pimeloyl-ACP methyl ester carboxylesterase